MKTDPGDLVLPVTRRSRHRAGPRTRVPGLVVRALLVRWVVRGDATAAPPGGAPSARSAGSGPPPVDGPRSVQSWWADLSPAQRQEVHALGHHEPLPDAVVVSLLVHGVVLDTGPDPSRVPQPPDLVNLLDREREHRRSTHVPRRTSPGVPSVLDLRPPV